MKQPTDLQIITRISSDDRRRLEALAEKWELSLAGTVRRAIKEAAAREKI